MPRESVLPRARPAAEFLIEELSDEVLVYDQRHHRAHCLTPELATLWRLCDGKRTHAQAAASLAERHAGAPLQTVASMIAALDKASLVEVARPRRAVDRSRRTFVRKSAIVATVAVASPVIFSIITPSVAEAASCGTVNLPCCAPPVTPSCVSGDKACVGGICKF